MYVQLAVSGLSSRGQFETTAQRSHSQKYREMIEKVAGASVQILGAHYLSRISIACVDLKNRSYQCSNRD